MQSSLFAYKAGTSLLFCCRSARKESDKESTDTAPLIAKRANQIPNCHQGVCEAVLNHKYLPEITTV